MTKKIIIAPAENPQKISITAIAKVIAEQIKKGGVTKNDDGKKI